MSSPSTQQQGESQNGPSPDISLLSDRPTSSTRTDRRSSIPKSLTSEDSQTSIIHHPSSSTSSPTGSPRSTSHKKRRSKSPTSRSKTPHEEPVKCWICFSDETEDTPTSSRWRSPCPCALRAHEACLLDWIADLQAPGKPRRPIECPQCNSKIRLARPVGFITALYAWIQTRARKSVMYISLATVAGGTLAGFWLHGLCTVYAVWGPEEASRWLEIRSGQPMSLWTRGSFSLPLIPMALIASRFSTFDGLMLALPTLHAGLTYHSTGKTLSDIDTLWPPSATAVMYCLPIVKLAYRELGRRCYIPLEKKFMQQLRPRVGEADEARGDGQADANDGREEGIALEVGIEVQVEEDAQVNQVEQDQMQVNQPQGQGPGPAAAEDHDLVAALAEPAADQAPHQNDQMRGFRLDVGYYVETIVGALAFPTAAAGIGGILWQNLPYSWVTPPKSWDRYPAGFLQTRFGRTIAGGILLLACKDAIYFYTLYDSVRTHKQRRVLNHDEAQP